MNKCAQISIGFHSPKARNISSPTTWEVVTSWENGRPGWGALRIIDGEKQDVDMGFAGETEG